MAKKFYFLFLLVLSACSACCFGAVPEYFYREGNIQSGRYSSPDLFSIKLPYFLDQPYVSELVTDDSKDIIFTDGSGILFRVTYIYAHEAIQEIEMECTKLFRRFLPLMLEKTIPQLQKAIPTAKVMQTQELTLADGRPALSAQILLPQGNIQTDVDSSIKFDLICSYLFFPLENNVVILSYQYDIGAILFHKLQQGDPLDEDLQLAVLLHTAHTCKPVPKKNLPSSLAMTGDNTGSANHF